MLSVGRHAKVTADGSGGGGRKRVYFRGEQRIPKSEHPPWVDKTCLQGTRLGGHREESGLSFPAGIPCSVKYGPEIEKLGEAAALAPFIKTWQHSNWALDWVWVKRTRKASTCARCRWSGVVGVVPGRPQGWQQRRGRAPWERARGTCTENYLSSSHIHTQVSKGFSWSDLPDQPRMAFVLFGNQIRSDKSPETLAHWGNAPRVCQVCGEERSRGGGKQGRRRGPFHHPGSRIVNGQVRKNSLQSLGSAYQPLCPQPQPSMSQTSPATLTECPRHPRL